jgi:hypothetical protein
VAKTSVTIKDRDLGFKKLAATLGEMGSITLGVQGKEALEKHPESELTVGEIAAIHELGLGVPKRSWLLSWMDANSARMLREAQTSLALVMKGVISRNKAMAALGFEWTKEIREVVSSGGVTPGLPQPRPDGTTAPLYDTHTLHNSITYKVFLPAFKSIHDPAQRAAARGGK